VYFNLTQEDYATMVLLASLDADESCAKGHIDAEGLVEREWSYTPNDVMEGT
jgi:hypothetical protein